MSGRLAQLDEMGLARQGRRFETASDQSFLSFCFVQRGGRRIYFAFAGPYALRSMELRFNGYEMDN
ncbi:hypothetical protein BPOR_0477g00020 [Botrytis porri]|uniref:Uncharacterized protein n=1 Tax=Botrytis porri TaxID=87229 RepID=A0A4Z1KGJ4_9HELO|nr:hypothetical protein BPOR_0477g00020 [Botrytis porri]